MGFYLKQRTILINLIVMSLVWLITSFSYYMLTFLLNTFEKVYTIATFNCLSAVVAYISAASILRFLGIKKTFSFGFGIALLAGLLILVYGLKYQDSFSFVLLYTMGNFGVNLGFGVIYASTTKIFPTLFCVTALGFCNIFARLFGSMSSLFAGME